MGSVLKVCQDVCTYINKYKYIYIYIYIYVCTYIWGFCPSSCMASNINTSRVILSSHCTLGDRKPLDLVWCASFSALEARFLTQNPLAFFDLKGHFKEQRGAARQRRLSKAKVQRETSRQVAHPSRRPTSSPNPNPASRHLGSRACFRRRATH